MKKNIEVAQPKQAIPLAIWALAVSIFAIGTNEVVMIGLLTTFVKEFSVDISTAGWIVTSYAMGVAFGGPIVTALTTKVSRKRLLIGILVLFILSNVLASTSTWFPILILARILSGVAHGVFVGIGANIASSLVTESKRATAIAIMFTGLTVAMVTGVPIGTYIGQQFGWRITFDIIAAIGLLCLLAIYFLLPDTGKPEKASGLSDIFRVLKNRSMLSGFSLTLFSFAGLFGTFTYLSPLLEEITGFDLGTITLILLLYGSFVAFGNIIGGKLSNRNPVKILLYLFIGLTIVMIGFYFLLPHKIPMLAIIALTGFFGFATVPGMQFNVIQIAEKHFKGTEDVVSVLNISAFNFGIALGSYIGGLIISSSLGLTFIPLMSAFFVCTAVVLCFISNKNH